MGRQRQLPEARTVFRNPRILLSISLLWLPCKFLLLQCLLLNDTMLSSFWNVGPILNTAWKWSSWRLIWEQDGTNVSFISDIHLRFLFVLPMLTWPSSAVLLKVPISSAQLQWREIEHDDVTKQHLPVRMPKTNERTNSRTGKKEGGGQHKHLFVIAFVRKNTSCQE